MARGKRPSEGDNSDASDRDKPAVADERSEPEMPRPEDPPPKQRELFLTLGTTAVGHNEPLPRP